MAPLSFKFHRFPPTIIRQAVWLYARFTLSYRDVEEILAERGIDVSYEIARRWFVKFGPAIAANLCACVPSPATTGISTRWSYASTAGSTGGGGRSIMRARSWTSLSRHGATPGPRIGS
jgi:hypothetical protein